MRLPWPPSVHHISCAHQPALPLPPQVEWLSGGEKARLALAKFMLTQVRGAGLQAKSPMAPEC